MPARWPSRHGIGRPSLPLVTCHDGELLNEQVVWIGGSPCSGKSTVAQLLAPGRRASVYHCDDAFDRHATAVSAAAGPTLKKVTTIGIAERLTQPLRIQVADVSRLAREEFPLILDDLGSMSGPVVAEGSALLPQLLATHGVQADRAVWMVPTPEFQRYHYGRRQWARKLLAGLPDAPGVFDTWMQRDSHYAADVAAQARDLGYRVWTVDGSCSTSDLAAQIAAKLDE